MITRRKRRSTFFLLVAGIALSIATMTACIPSTQQAQVQPTTPVAGTPQEAQRVTLEESKAALDRDAVIFLDVRSESAYATSHIPGAVSIPLAELEPRIAELDPEQWIITYCT